MKNTICKSEKCTGCSACFNICPKDCISMEADEYGHIVPVINEEVCINCNLCRKICPSNNKYTGKDSINAYALYNLDKEDRKYSSSGGVATVLSRHILENGGVVFGSVVDNDLKVVHKGIKDHNGIERLKGSKYVQSYIGTTFKQVKEELISGKEVIFIGTPCQVAGLNSFLGKEYNNLITVDLVCHGVPPMKYLEEHINKIKKGLKEDVTDLTFRGRNDFRFSLYSKEKCIYSKSREWDLYFRGFLKGLFYRESCYSCDYANPKRVSDITIGDFWGIGKDKPFNNKDKARISVALTNNIKGEKFLLKLENKFFIEKREVSEAVNGNAQLRKPSIMHNNHKKFNKDYLKYGFEKASGKSLNKERIKEAIKSKLKVLKNKIFN